MDCITAVRFSQLCTLASLTADCKFAIPIGCWWKGTIGTVGLLWLGTVVITACRMKATWTIKDRWWSLDKPFSYIWGGGKHLLIWLRTTFTGNQDVAELCTPNMDFFFHLPVVVSINVNLCCLPVVTMFCQFIPKLAKVFIQKNIARYTKIYFPMTDENWNTMSKPAI